MADQATAAANEQTTAAHKDFEALYAPSIEAVFGVKTLVRSAVYSAFVSEYGAFVVHLISKRNKVTRNSSEIVQELFTQLQEAHLIEKFFEQARLSMPETVCAEQAYRMLGVTWDQFRVAIWAHTKGYPTKKAPGRGAGPRNERGHVQESKAERKKASWMPTPPGKAPRAAFARRWRRRLPLASLR